MYRTVIRKSLAGLMSLSVAFGSASLVRAQAEEEPESASDVKPKPTKVSGVFESKVAHELKADTEHIDAFKLKRLLDHGASVNEGDNVVWFETEDVQKQVKNAETEFKLSKLTFADDEFAYEQFLKTQALDRENATRARDQAQQAYDNFVQVDRDRQKVTAEFSLKSSKASLENAMEELKQLEQMYKEDDLTEESEEIVLKRAKRSVESAQYRLDSAKISFERSMEQAIPRSIATQEDALARAELAFAKSTQDLDSARKKREIEIERKRDKFKEEEEDLAELKEERKRIVLSAPVSGIVLHGKLTRGKLPEKPSTLQPGSKITAQQVIVTIVDPDRLQIRVSLNENQVGKVNVGATCKVTAPAVPGFESTGKVKSVSPVAYAGTKFDCVVTFKASKDQPTVMPTMTCELEFEAHED